MTLFDNATLGLTSIVFLAFLAYRLGKTQQLGNIAFTVWVIVAVVWALFFPETLQTWNGSSLKALIIPLLMIIMFGMDTAMSLHDFKGILKMPKVVRDGSSFLPHHSLGGRHAELRISIRDCLRNG